MPIVFSGNCPGNVAKDAKYSIRNENGQFVVGVIYATTGGERWHATTSAHRDLVDIVNKIKIENVGTPGGAFYINEYKQVIVPAGKNASYYLAGEYHKPLEFMFQDKILSGNALNLNGEPIKPGEKWVGPHPGIPYTLTAGGADIYFECIPAPNVTRKIKLSSVRDKADVLKVCSKIAAIKGQAGGRFYINEYQQLFSPINQSSGVDYVYIGKLDSLDLWFSKPHADATFDRIEDGCDTDIKI